MWAFRLQAHAHIIPNGWCNEQRLLAGNSCLLLLWLQGYRRQHRAVNHHNRAGFAPVQYIDT